MDFPVSSTGMPQIGQHKAFLVLVWEDRLDIYFGKVILLGLEGLFEPPELASCKLSERHFSLAYLGDQSPAKEIR
jgi:hypothetical protein